MPHDDKPVSCWRCPNCGQMYFGDNPPDMCDFCGDFTTWRAVLVEQPPKPKQARRRGGNEDAGPSRQLPLFE